MWFRLREEPRPGAFTETGGGWKRRTLKGSRYTQAGANSARAEFLRKTVKRLANEERQRRKAPWATHSKELRGKFYVAYSAPQQKARRFSMSTLNVYSFITIVLLKTCFQPTTPVRHIHKHRCSESHKATLCPGMNGPPQISTHPQASHL